MRNEEVLLYRVKEESHILHTIEIRKANWIGHMLSRNCLLKHITEGKIGELHVTERRGRRRKQLLHNLKETRKYWKSKEKALDRSLWRTHFGKGYGPGRKTDYRKNEIIIRITTLLVRSCGSEQAKDSALVESNHSLSSHFSDFNINNLNAWRMDTFIFLKAIS